VFSSDDFLVPGLPDEIVLHHVWPRIRRDFEHVARTSVLLDPVKEIMKNLIHLSHVSKRWRCLVTNSTYWPTIRILIEDPPMSVGVPPRYFRHHVRNLPPIVAFS